MLGWRNLIDSYIKMANLFSYALILTEVSTPSDQFLQSLHETSNIVKIIYHIIKAVMCLSSLHIPLPINLSSPHLNAFAKESSKTSLMSISLISSISRSTEMSLMMIPFPLQPDCPSSLMSMRKGDSSPDFFLQPVMMCRDPFRKGRCKLVLCDVVSQDRETCTCT